MPPPIPRDFREKRKLLYGEKVSDEEMSRAAAAFSDAGRFGEALEFLERTRDEEVLARIEREAVERGDTFLLLRVERIRGRDLGPDRWRHAAARALVQGKHLDAFRAFGRAGDAEKAEEIRAAHLPGYEPYRPEGKQA
jgi:hypothetical protein